MSSDLVLALVRCENEAAAAALARAAVEERLAACGNLVPLEADWLLVLKTTARQQEALLARLGRDDVQLLRAAEVHGPYMEWVSSPTQAE